MAFHDEIQEHMRDVPSWSRCSHVYSAVRTSKPFINTRIMSMFVNNVWATSSFASSEYVLDKAMSLFLWCPADRRSAVFQEKDKELTVLVMRRAWVRTRAKLQTKCHYYLNARACWMWFQHCYSCQQQLEHSSTKWRTMHQHWHGYSISQLVQSLRRRSRKHW